MKISKTAFFTIGLTLFSMFFGAGNFIFPPYLASQAGSNTLIATLSFCITAVLFPVLGIAALAKANGLYNLSKRVDKIFAVLFPIALLLIIGPIFAIPRAANVPFEISIKPFLPGNLSENSLSLLVYSVIYFVINYLVCIKPSKIIHILGKILTPMLLLVIVALFIATLFNPMHSGNFASPDPASKWAISPITSGIIEGYQTMDTLAALAFGLIVLVSYRAMGIRNRKLIIKSTIGAGLIAGVILAIIYVMLAYVGVSSAGTFPNPQNGAEILVNSTNFLFGKFGNIILAIGITLACLTTTIGLITSISEYFASMSDKINYKQWVLIWAVISSLMANFGLNKIIDYAVPVLYIIYPAALSLIALSLLNNYLRSNKLIYASTVYVAMGVSVVNMVDNLYKIKIPFLGDICEFFPLYSDGMAWVIPTILICLISSGIAYLKEKQKLMQS
ncbi:MAG: branched-chain amino acid transport system II carrier protein [Campylobacter sp.]|nr:branched-chain amino acid transport system II carrier protein [Campylobacter sp.]